ncbi:midas domain-containing protein [Clostridium brassicae]|uniref:Transmembrane protein n=1 Tax=Clostridium brassicae TaxID=2999072 RepID=A0ABT4DDI4_9CLOT|nr:hypothetical protein [Clostridium brassicae]MCY6959206.1 hypothetical protein [Clostridium brassicae]
MATKKSYSRYFIILQEDEKGFSTDVNKFPTGYTKIEKKNDKCKVSYYVQNLKKDKEPYYMVLICNSKDTKKLIKLGEMNLDNFGSSEVSYEYEVSNLASSGIGMDAIKGACIVNFKDVNMSVALTGFINGVKLDNWKAYSIIEPKEKFRDSEVDKNIEQDIEVSNDNKEVNIKDTSTKGIQEEKMQDEIDSNKNSTESNMFDEYESDIEKFKNINKDVKDIDDLNKSSNEVDDIDSEAKCVAKSSEKVELDREVNLSDQTDEHSENVDSINQVDQTEDNSYKQEEYRKSEERDKKSKNKCKEDKEDKNKEDKNKIGKDDKDEYPLGATGKFFKNLAKDLEEVYDICPEMGKCKWYKVPVEQLETINPLIDFRIYNMLYYPMSYYYPYIKKQGHYLIGYKCDSNGDMKYLVYAIPGTKMVYDQPFGGTTGFTTWTCKKYDDDKMHSKGYWVMFYDFKNCRVMIPVM